MAMRRRKPAFERLMAHTEKADGGCWLYGRSVTASGYCQMRVWDEQAESWIHKAGHRITYEELVGPIPPGLDLDHLCRVRHCVNPAHLEPVTRQVNVLRGISLVAREVTVTHCPHGHPYDLLNTHHGTDGARHCRACDRDRHQARRDREKAMRLTA